MKRIATLVILLITSLIAACGGESQTVSQTVGGEPVEIELRNYGPAPELTNTVWLNTDSALRLADLRGKVVAIDFWTFG
jgi:hypothetical protein